MNKICTNCKFYPRSWFRKLFNLKPLFNDYSKCTHPYTVSLDGKPNYCVILRSFSHIGSCCQAGIYFEPYKKEPK